MGRTVSVRFTMIVNGAPCVTNGLLLLLFGDAASRAICTSARSPISANESIVTDDPKRIEKVVNLLSMCWMDKRICYPAASVIMDQVE
jgi:hypothetical protein